MPSIVSYRKFINETITRELSLPTEPGTANRLGQELATIDGVTYVSLPDGATLPANQPAEISSSIQAQVVLTDELREDIKSKSPVLRMISDSMTRQIRSMYSVEDEMYFARIGVGAANGLYSPTPKEMAEMRAFGSFVEGVRQWGRQERAKYGI